MISGLRKLVKGALWDAKGTLSLSRCFLLFVAVEVTVITWLVVAWCWYITKNGLLVDAAPFASSVSTGAAAVLSSQVAAAAWQYFTQARYTGGGVSGRQLDIAEARTEIAAADAEMGMSSPPGLVPHIGSDIVPDSQSEPRVAAESQNASAPTVATLAVEDPIEVAIVENSTSEPVEVSSDEHSSDEHSDPA